MSREVKMVEKLWMGFCLSLVVIVYACIVWGAYEILQIVQSTHLIIQQQEKAKGHYVDPR